MTGRFVSLTVLAFIAFSTPVGARGEERGRSLTSVPSSVWVVEKGGRRIFVGGTIHLLRAQDYPLPDVFYRAYQHSSKLVFELPPDSSGKREVVTRMRDLGTYPKGDDLTHHLSAEMMDKVEKWAKGSPLPRSEVLKMRPWFLALTIAMTEYQKLGAEPGRGVDQVFEDKATQDRKLGDGLEKVEDQLSLFSNLSEKLQEELLQQTFTEAETMRKDFTELINAWREGNATKLHELLFRDEDKYPELTEEFLLKRNKLWAPRLLGYLNRGETVFVLVGAGHLGGKGGVLDLLKQEGCRVWQLGGPIPAVPYKPAVTR